MVINNYLNALKLKCTYLGQTFNYSRHRNKGVEVASPAHKWDRFLVRHHRWLARRLNFWISFTLKRFELIMADCVDCGIILNSDEIHYFIRDLGPEIHNILQQKLAPQEFADNDELCEMCFTQLVTDLSVQEGNAPFIPVPLETNLCVWCRLSLYQRDTHSMRGSLRTFIRDLIHPRQIPPGGLLCLACWVYARQIMQTQNPQENQELQADLVEQEELVDENVCVWCLRSLASRHVRRHSLPDGPERNEITNRIYPRVIPEGGRVCFACWVSARRNVQRQRDGRPDGPGHRLHHVDSCAWCQTSLHRRLTRHLPSGPERDVVSSNIHPRELSQNALVCMECWGHIQLQLNVEQSGQPIMQILESQMDLDYKKSTNSSSHCFVPGCTNSERQSVPNHIRKQILKEKKIYVTKYARVCMHHKSQYNWDMLEQDDFGSTFTKNEIHEMLNLATEEVNMFLNFENTNSIDDSLFKYWTGLTILQFNYIVESVPMLSNLCKIPKTALGVFLIKIRTGDSHERIASLLQISRAKVSRLLKSVREALTTQFVPLHLGVNHTNREEFINRNLLIPKGLFGESENRNAIIIMDGTYVYLQKSSNYFFQKTSYSLHKYRNLVKPFLIVATDGHILDIFGPYPATTSDADITKTLFQNDTEFRRFFRPGDVFILDRGFRDAIPLLQEQGFTIHKPESLEEGERQLTFDKANKSRCVTLCRWVVEVVNGRFKRDYKIFRQDFFNCAATHLMVDFRICGALINAFHQEISDRPDAQLILDRALEKLHVPNTLGSSIVDGQINRYRAGFVRIDAVLPELEFFPQMDQSELILFALGTYQIKQACSYYGEHIRTNGSFEVEVCTQLERINLEPSNAKLLRGRIRSRHSTNRVYYTYILLLPNKIQSYYCTCICGMRTVGCCAHVMTIVWYLGWARHQDSISAPASFLDGILCREDNDE